LSRIARSASDLVRGGRSDLAQHRHRDPKAAALGTQRAQFARDLVGDVPRQDKHIVGVEGGEDVRRDDWQVAAGEEAAIGVSLFVSACHCF
jgi:hypothetical protein